MPVHEAAVYGITEPPASPTIGAMQEVLGQSGAVSVLLNAVASKRIHHCWILAGPRGVGKFTTARAFAKLLLDPGAGPDLTGQWSVDPASPAARLVEAGTHPDFHVITKELALHSANPQLRSRKLTNLPVDVLREHMIGGKTSDDRTHEAPAYRTPKMGHGKVFVIDDADQMDFVGQNALLKTLEEPPPRTYIFLVTEHPERLLATIRSRSQLVRFGRLDAGAMDAWIQESSLEVPPEAAGWLLDFAEGSPGMLTLAVEHDLHAWRSELEPMVRDASRGIFPAPLGETLASLVERYADAVVKSQPNASKDAANKAGAGHLLALLAHDARSRVARAATDGLDTGSLLHTIDLLREAELALASNVNMKQAFENLAVQWANSAAGP